MRTPVVLCGWMLVAACGSRSGLGEFTAPSADDSDNAAQGGGSNAGSGGATEIARGGSAPSAGMAGAPASGGSTTAGTAGENAGGPSGGSDAWAVAAAPFPPPAPPSCGNCWTPGTPALLLVWNSGPEDVWIAASAESYKAPPLSILLHGDGQKWSTTSPGVQRIASLSGVSTSDVWIGSGSYFTNHPEVTNPRQVSRWNGTGWSDVPAGDGELVWENSSRDVWSCCSITTDAQGAEQRQARHWDGAVWSASPLPVGISPVRNIWSASADQAWLVGDAGLTIHWNGVTWSVVPSGTTEQLNAVWGEPGGTAWAIGTNGTILQYDGSEWLPPGSNAATERVTPNELADIWGGASGELWVVGGGGTILHWNRERWEQELSHTDVRLNSIWGTSAHDIWAVGNDGVVLHKSR